MEYEIVEIPDKKYDIKYEITEQGLIEVLEKIDLSSKKTIEFSKIFLSEAKETKTEVI